MTPQELIDELYDAVDLDDMYSRSYLVYAVEDLCAENAKLRELVAALYRCADAGKPCETCPLFDGEGGCLDADRMHELGIEVNA